MVKFDSFSSALPFAGTYKLETAQHIYLWYSGYIVICCDILRGHLWYSGSNRSCTKVMIRYKIHLKCRIVALNTIYHSQCDIL